MALQVEESIIINRPREEVWAYVVEQDEWRRPDVINVEKLSDGPPGVGTQYKDTVEMMGNEMSVVNEIIHFEPPSKLSWTQVSEQGPIETLEGSYLLEALDGKTRFTLMGTYQASGLAKLLTPLMQWQLQNKIFPRFVRQLKEILESER